MQQPWLAERLVSAELATALIAANFPELVPLSLHPIGEGWDNIAYVVNNEWVFRFPRRAVAVPLLQTERLILQVICETVTLAVPVPIYYAEGGTDYDWPFAGYRLLKGITACGANLEDSERLTIAPQLACFLRELHNFPVAQAAELGVPGDTLARMDVKGRKNKTAVWFDNLEKHELLSHSSRCLLQAMVDEAEDCTVDHAELRLLHGDLYSRHIVICRDDGVKVSGIIDWGDVHIGHIATDLAVMYSLLPPQARQVFRLTYGPIDRNTELLARFRAASHGAAVLAYAADINDEDLMREGTRSLNNVLNSVYD